MIARVLRGESPASIPFYRLETTKLVVNPGDAGKMGVTLPPDLVKQADSVVGGAAHEAMKIDAAREGGSALLQLEGRLDREWAEHLSDTLEDLLQDGVRSLSIDFSRVTYVSSAATRVLARWHQELAVLRGEVQLTSLPPAVREVFADAGWDSGFAADRRSRLAPRSISGSRPGISRADFAASGQYELSSSVPGGHVDVSPARRPRAAHSDCRWDRATAASRPFRTAASASASARSGAATRSAMNASGS